ncbi:MAG: hypothetical protein QG641_1161 [Candidatus Poribacteria bacterium]|nr:hypothetical protein [Candidatus Poribacteria bacterium]MDQ1327877.1 hypothetical protein [Candidatus Poribacteria bacterium]
MDFLKVIVNARDVNFDTGHLVESAKNQYLNEIAIEYDHRQIIETYNGLYAFGRALHIFGCSKKLPFHDISTRNHPAEWRLMYGEDVVGLLFFAEDVFGNLWAYSNEGILFFDIESAGIEIVSSDFAGWIKYIAEDIDYTTGRSLAQRWAKIHGSIPFGSRLCSKKPFILGGEYEVDNLYALSWEQNLLFKADIARQIKGLPDGTEIKFEVVDD